MKTIQFPNEKFFPDILEWFEKTKTISINLKGNSMRPFLESGRDVGIISKPEALKKGDVVLAEIEKGHYVLHRVDQVRLNGREVRDACSDPEADVILRGDGNARGTENCKIKDVRALCVKVKRNGKEYDLKTSLTWKVYSWIWTRALPLRRYLLALYKLLWRHELPQRWKKNK